MPTTIAELRAVIEIEDSRFQEGMRRDGELLEDTAKKAEKTSDAFSKLGEAGDKLGRLGTMLTLGITVPITAAGAAAIKFGSDLNESMSKAQVVFGNSSQAVLNFAQNADRALGMSKQQATEATATFGNLFVALGLGQDKSAQLSTSLVQLAADLASFNNVNPEDALLALRAGLVGETEPLRRFGVNLNQATIEAQALKMGLISSTKDALDPATKAQAAYALILEQTKTAQGDYARTSGGLANQMRTLQASFRTLLEEVGIRFLPVAQQVTKWAIDTIQWFKQWPVDFQNAAIAVAGLTAAIGPLILGIAAAFKVIVTIKEGLEAVVAIRAAVVAAWTAKTVAIGANTAALQANTAAASANAAAGTAAATSGGGLGILGGASRFLGPAGIVAAGVGIGYGANVIIDRMQGKADVDFGTTLKHLNPFRTQADDDREGITAANRLAQENRAEFALKGTPRQQLLASQRAAQAQVRAEDASLVDARFAAQLETARGGSGDAISDATRLTPVLTQRAQSLRERLKGMQESQKEYWETQRDITQVENQISELQQRATQERKDKQIKTQQQTAQAREAINATLLQQAQISLIGTPDSQRAQAEAQRVIPLLVRQQQELAQEAQRLLPEARKSAEANLRYNQLARESATLEAQIMQLRYDASQEIRANQEKATSLQREVMGIQFEAQTEFIQAQIEQLQEGQRAQGQVTLMVPHLRQLEQQIMADMQKQTPAMKEYWENQKQLGSLEREIARIQSDAVREREQNTKKAQDDAKKALDSQRRQFQESQQIDEARVRLAQAQLRNNPFLSDAQRKQAILPLLVSQFQHLQHAGPSESELEGLNRQISAQGVLGEIMQGMGGGAGARAFGGGQLGFGNPRMMQQVSAMLRSSADVRQIAHVAQNNRPLVLQIVLDKVNTREQLRREFDRLYDTMEKELYPGPAALP